jgi:SNF2 family DNA or RNA helicase
MEVTVDLWEHQKQMVAFAQKQFSNTGQLRPFGHGAVEYCYWIAGCRTGKTLASIALAKDYKRTLIITKKTTILDAWKKELSERTEDVSYFLVHDGIHTRDGLQTKKTLSAEGKALYLRSHVPYTDQAIVVVNYETARLIIDTLRLLNFDYVVLDESHMVKAHDSQTSMQLARHLKGVRKKLIMTGTSWNDRPTDVYGQIRFLAPANDRGRSLGSAMLGSYTNFFEKHVDYREKDNIKIPENYKELDGIRTIINPFTMYIRTEDVIDLPPAVDIEFVLDAPKEMERAYQQLEDDMVAKFGDDLLIADNKLVQGLRLHQLTIGYYVDELGQVVEFLEPKDNPKLQKLLDIVDEAGGEPIVVFTRFKHDVVIIERALKEAGISTKKLVGGLDEHVEWQQGAGQVLIANIQAGGAGITLNRANLVVYYSVGNSNTDFEQSLWRVRDAHQGKTVFYHHIMIAGTVDVEIRQALKVKGKMSDFMLAGLVNRITHASNIATHPDKPKSRRSNKAS